MGNCKTHPEIVPFPVLKPRMLSAVSCRREGPAAKPASKQLPALAQAAQFAKREPGCELRPECGDHGFEARARCNRNHCDDKCITLALALSTNGTTGMHG